MAKQETSMSRVIGLNERRSVTSTINRYWADLSGKIGVSYVFALNGVVVPKDKFNDTYVVKGDVVTVTPIAVGG